MFPYLPKYSCYYNVDREMKYFIKPKEPPDLTQAVESVNKKIRENIKKEREMQAMERIMDSMEISYFDGNGRVRLVPEYVRVIQDEMRRYNFGITAVPDEYIDKEVRYDKMFIGGRNKHLQIKNVVFNDPATIIFWNDGTKTVVKCENEPFDPEKGMAMAVSKKFLAENQGNYYDIFKKYLPDSQ